MMKKSIKSEVVSKIKKSGVLEIGVQGVCVGGVDYVDVVYFGIVNNVFVNYYYLEEKEFQIVVEIL